MQWWCGALVQRAGAVVLRRIDSVVARRAGAVLVRCWCVVGAVLVRCWCGAGASVAVGAAAACWRAVYGVLLLVRC